jgi:nucleoside-diphosphate-sugar epimerase
MERVLVTGATGFIGYEVSRQLATRGFRPRLLVRRPLRAPLLKSLDAELIQGDLESEVSLERAVRDIDTVIHLGARATFESYSALRPTIVDGSLALMRAACSASVKKFVYASSLLVYDSQTEPIDRKTPAAPRVAYGRAKLEAETRLGDLARQGEVCFAAIRIPHAYGARDLLFERIRAGRVIAPGLGKNQLARIHIEDVARVLIAAAEQGWSGILPIADFRSASWNEFFNEVKKYYPGFRLLQSPSWMAYLGAGCLGMLRVSRSRPRLHTPDAVIGWNLNLPVKAGILWEELGMPPRFSTIYEGIPAVMDDCIAFRWTHPISDRS